MITNTNVTIMVNEMDKSISFYQAIGFEVKNRWGDYYAQLVAPGIVIGLHPTTDTGGPSGNGRLSIGFTAQDFENVKSSLAGMSISATLRKEAGGEFLHFTDPDGIPLYFIKPK